MSGGRASRQKGDRAERAIVIVKADRLEPLVVLRLKFASEITALAEQTKNSCKPGSAAGRSPVSNDMIRKDQS
jgi:hypothetical protein